MSGNFGRAVVLLGIILPTASTASGVQDKPSAPRSCCSIVENALQAAGNIKSGMSRADVEKEFRLEGGLFAREESFYVYRKCPLIKITVRFELDPSYHEFVTGSPADRVTSVSKPRLEYPVMD